MEYIQTTLDDWIQMKEQLKNELMGVQASFISIGYILRQIEEQELYKNDDYATITEFAKEEYNLSASTVSRFIAINKRYSIDGYSKYIDPKYAQLGSSKLADMLALPEMDMAMITPETQRQNIRELKAFNKSEPQEGIADEIKDVIICFFKDNPDILNDFYSSEASGTDAIEEMIEIINPSGNKAYKKGLYFLMMYDRDIKIKKYGQEPITMSWSEFFIIMNEIFAVYADGANTYVNYFGEPEVEPEPEPLKKEKSKVAPAQKKEQNKPKKKEQKKAEVITGVEAEIIDLDRTARLEEAKTIINTIPNQTYEECVIVDETKTTAAAVKEKVVIDIIKESTVKEVAVLIATKIQNAIASGEEHNTVDYWYEWLNKECKD